MGKEDYKKRIIDMINKINDAGTLEYLHQTVDKAPSCEGAFLVS